MSLEQIMLAVLSLLISIIGYFLKNLLQDVSTLIHRMNKAEIQLEIIKNNQGHTEDTVDELKGLIKELILEMKHLAISMERNKKNE